MADRLAIGCGECPRVADLVGTSVDVKHSSVSTSRRLPTSYVVSAFPEMKMSLVVLTVS